MAVQCLKIEKLVDLSRPKCSSIALEIKVELMKSSSCIPIGIHHAMAAIAIACLFATAPAIATAGPVSFIGTSGDRSARVDFNVGGINGEDLIVTLTNISTHDVMVPTDVLTAVFFDLATNSTVNPNNTLDRVSAVLPSGVKVYLDGVDVTPADRVVGGEWTYKAGLSGAPGGTQQGISSTGLGLFGKQDRFPPGVDLSPPDNSPDGLQYGITSAGDNLATQNGGVANNELIKNSVVFTLRGLATGFDPMDGSISNVWFQYGTSLSEQSSEGIRVVPEPSSFVLLSLGCLALAFYGVWRHNRRFGCSANTPGLAL